MSLAKRIIRTLIQLTSLAVLAYTVVAIAESSNYIQVKENKILHMYGEFSLIPENRIYGALIRLSGEDGFFCSATVIDSHFAITAGHCVVGMFGKLKDDPIDIGTEDGKATGIQAEAVAVDLYRDVALLTGDFSSFKSIAIDFSGSQTMMLANKVALACGFPGGGDTFCSAVVLVGNVVFRIAGVGGILQKGMSGGPLVDVATETIIGVNSAAGSDYNIFGAIMGVDEIFGIRK